MERYHVHLMLKSPQNHQFSLATSFYHYDPMRICTGIADGAVSSMAANLVGIHHNIATHLTIEEVREVVKTINRTPAIYHTGCENIKVTKVKGKI